MTRQVALLRGINLARNNRVDMARLRALVQDLGYERVRTHLQSGNIVFTAAATPPERVARDIEEQLRLHLGLSVPVVVRSRDELAEILGRKPLPDAEIDPARFLVVFLSASADPAALRELGPAAFEPGWPNRVPWPHEHGRHAPFRAALIGVRGRRGDPSWPTA